PQIHDADAPRRAHASAIPWPYSSRKAPFAWLMVAFGRCFRRPRPACSRPAIPAPDKTSQLRDARVRTSRRGHAPASTKSVGFYALGLVNADTDPDLVSSAFRSDRARRADASSPRATLIVLSNFCFIIDAGVCSAWDHRPVIGREILFQPVQQRVFKPDQTD